MQKRTLRRQKKSCVDTCICKQITNLRQQDFPDSMWVLLIDETEFTHICNVCQDVSLHLYKESWKLTWAPSCMKIRLDFVGRFERF